MLALMILFQSVVLEPETNCYVVTLENGKVVRMCPTKERE